MYMYAYSSVGNFLIPKDNFNFSFQTITWNYELHFVIQIIQSSRPSSWLPCFQLRKLSLRNCLYGHALGDS